MAHSTRARLAIVAAGLAVLLSGATPAADLDGPVSIIYDQYRVPTVVATTEHDAIYMQGYLHAQNRFFQMDITRRQGAGTLSELLGPAALPTDVQLRTLGLRRAAERSLPVQTPEVTAWLEAYSDGVNAWLNDTSNPLPLEYSLIEIDRGGIPQWTPLDTLTAVKALAFNLSFDLGDIDRTLAVLNFRGVGDALGFNGLQLFNNDLYRTEPFDTTTSIPPGGLSQETPPPPADEETPEYLDDPNFGPNLQNLRDTLAEVPVLERALTYNPDQAGSNWWIFDETQTENGLPMLINDPHLALDQPATFYEVHLVVTGGMNVTGVSFPGAPGVVQGCNETICWGSTVNPLDVTDVYQEVLLTLGPDPTQVTHSFYEGAPEPLEFIPQTFLVNGIGDGFPNTLADAGVPATSGGVTIVVPRRTNGPIVQVDFDPTSATPFTGFSVQYTGFAATQELECFRRFARAGTMQDFKDALQFFDVGSQNWAYADVNGNIAYYTSAELPLRTDLQFGFFPAGLQPPYLIRDGTNTLAHDWLPVLNPQPNQAIPHEMLPFAEMPQIENPAAGYVLNANNDPIGTSLDNVSYNQFRAGFNGVLYLSPGYAPGYRMGRIQRLVDDLLASGGKVSVLEGIQMQANNQLLDAEVLTPYITDAFANATAPGADPTLAALAADPRVAEAVGRLGAWDFSTPTGIIQGFDPFDNPAAPVPPSAAEVDASVAATIYALWRGQIVQRTIDTTLASLPVPLDAFAPGSAEAMKGLRRLLEVYPTQGGSGASLLNFFVVPGITDADDARDIIILQSLQNGLALAASPEFAPAFGESSDLEDYRWGYLHRVRFDSILDPQLSIPPVGSPQNVSPDLPGFARAGGMGAVDASSHSARADGLNEFMFGSGPNRRVVATMRPEGPEILEVIPGGQSGAPGSPQQIDQLTLWLVNAYKPRPVILAEAEALGVETQSLVCGDGEIDPGEACDDGNSDDADGCADCMLAPAVTCSNLVVEADKDCIGSFTCEEVASCVDEEGNPVPVSCDPDGGGLALGTTDVTVTCMGVEMTTQTTCQVELADVDPPSGGIDQPQSGLCFGGPDLPIEVSAMFDDACDPDVDVSFDPGTSFVDQGDYTVTVTATDDSGNSNVEMVSFSIDLTNPTVELFNLNDVILPNPDVPMTMFVGTADEDVASGGVTYEQVVLENNDVFCTLLDGNAYGDGDGLLIDETLNVSVAQLQATVDACGITRLDKPTICFEAFDCGGNKGQDCVEFDDHRFDSLRVRLFEDQVNVAWGAEGQAYHVCTGSTPTEARDCVNPEANLDGINDYDAGPAAGSGIVFYVIEVDETP